MSVDQPAASVRLVEAQQRAEERLRRQRDLLRPLGWAVIAVVVASVVTQRPGPGTTPTGVVLASATVVFAGATAVAIGDRFVSRGHRFQFGVLIAMAAAGVTLSWLQPRGTTDLAAGAAGWLAITRLRLSAGVSVAVAAGLGQAAAAARTGSSSAVMAVLLLTALLGVVAYLMRQSRDSQTGTEMLLAQLADARDAQAVAAVVAERSRIAAELHDVLAHTLSGAALHLQGARMLAERQHASPSLSEAIEGASRLVADGLISARQAVQTLRGKSLPSLAQLDQLVVDCRRDLQLDVTLRIEGTPRDLAPEPALALYRGVQEALTNAARHAPGSVTQVRLTYDRDQTTVQVENTRSPAAQDAGAPQTPLSGLGGGNGLAGLRERISQIGGTLAAGPTEDGWRVRLAVPSTPAPT
ncbi:MAG: sensor histidine kinase [Mycobacteriaceae bacterium]